MKKIDRFPRAILILAAFALLLGGIFLITADPGQNPHRDKSAVSSSPQDAGLRESGQNPRPAPQPREREESAITYVSQHSGETLKLVMDKFVARSALGRDEIVTLHPAATPATLAKRLAEHQAPKGVFPLAYDETDRYDGLRLITSDIRVKIPREQAETFAREHGLAIAELPDYAPEWVIFAAADPFAALDKISAVRQAENVDSADILIGRRPVTMALPNDPLILDQWHHKASGEALPGSDLNVEGAWNYAGGAAAGVRGRGVRIGIIDSGIQTNHPDFIGSIDTAIDRDFITGSGNPNPVYEDESHGTAVGGKAGARGNNGLGVAGVAPESTLVGLRLITGDFTTDSQNASALSHRTDVIEIKNNSWGYRGALYKTEPLLNAALKNSSENGRGGKGTIFTFSAGNSGSIEEQDSANYSELTSSIYTLAVGATTSKNKRTFYSEPGANVVISAPSGGVPGHPLDQDTLGITTTDRTGRNGYDDGDYTDGFNGTSSSCPAVSGVIALMLERNPGLGWRDVHDILIRTARKIDPANPGWTTNAAGLHFNNDFGAGLVDATAAVNMAAGHTNLGQHTSVTSNRPGLPLSIPNNSSTGRDVLFSLPGSNIITEHVTVRLTIRHSARGELEISLISPSGTVSRLAEIRDDLDADYTDYTFSSVRNWGENSSGTWTLKVADRRSGKNTTGGVITAAELKVFGVFAPPVNPPPDVRIASPADGDVFSPGVGFTVRVNATDLDIDSNPDTIDKVELYQNGVLVGTDRSAPYEFPRNPANGSYNYVARATDSEGLVGASPSVLVVVKNQTPVISSASLNAGNQAYDDLPLSVVGLAVNDPESDPLTLSYRWESSVDEDNYSVSGFTGARLAPNPAHSGKLWRCVITASDGNTVSVPFVTESVNLLNRPQELPVRPGAPYSYRSELVLKGDTLVIDRPAVIHEFSQGFAGGTSEWIEILTLRAGDFSGWSLQDDSGRTLKFAADAWGAIPAGTLIVVYNGSEVRDPLLPASIPAGAMVVSSSDRALFTPASQWPTFDNTGDSLFLRDGADVLVHSLSYGGSFSTSLNVGQVQSGQAAYFSGQNPQGAALANEWLRTTASTARTATFEAAPLAIFPGEIFTNGQYRQDFDLTPGADSVYFPTGWSAYSVSVGNTQTTNFDELLLPAGFTSQGGVFNFGSRIGIVGGFSASGTKRFDPGFFALALDNTLNLTGLKISYDVIKILEPLNSRSIQFSLEYSTGNPANTSSSWFPVPGASYISGTIPRDTVTRFQNVPLPAIFHNRESPIYLRWVYRTDPQNGGTGAFDAIALDNVVIASDSAPNIFLDLSINPSVVLETGGANASVGTVTLSEPLSLPLTVGISSSDTSEVTVPSSVIIPAGQLSATFPIAAFDDIVSDGTQTSTVTVSAPGFLNVSGVITILDNEPVQVGVTPALPNNPTNSDFVRRVREGRLSEAATFRIADGSALPDGLSLDANTGLISGTVSSAAPEGSYTVVIERRNVIGGFTSQTIVIIVSKTIKVSYSRWISGFNLSDKSVTGDTDYDFLPNLVEYALGSDPSKFDNPQPMISGRDNDTVWITYSKSKDAIDVILTVEWSTNMKNGTWKTDGVTHRIMSDGVNSQTIRSSITIDPARPANFMRLSASLPEPK